MYQELKEKLLREHKRSSWGILLIFRDEFYQYLGSSQLILDVGCNIQYLKKAVLERKPSSFVVGLDIVNYSCIKDQKVDVLASAEQLPFRDNCFDFASFIETLEHVRSEPAVEECFRVLKPEGRVYIQSVHRNDPAFPNDPTHVTPLDEHTLMELLGSFKHKEIRRVHGTLVAKAVK